MTAAGREIRIGRFAPSPTGPLHAGSLVAALASWLDARAQGGRWLVRIEDGDTERCLPGLGEEILRQLAACGLVSDETPVWQTQRLPLYERALDQLIAAQRAYPCGCTRAEIDEALARSGVAHTRHGERVYPGTCRDGLHGKRARAWRFATQALEHSDAQAEAPPDTQSAAAVEASTNAALDAAARHLAWHDRRLGAQSQDVVHEVGDFVLRRADGPWAYQLRVVVDDADQHITDVVRGEDLTDNTPRQILLQRALGLPTPRYLHTPLVRGPDGEKLSKQHGAVAFDTRTPAAALAELRKAAQVLGLSAASASAALAPADALAAWVAEWRDLYNPPP
ncbi:MAG: tRNA glutamyl-Q(34) synthetase GluQRS [Variovorax sp.]|nr:MAG: tRNA glutamyl-Q(34) synthetase GluQRS [Variovorax sp.]